MFDIVVGEETKTCLKGHSKPKTSSSVWLLPWLTERLYLRRTGVPVNRLLGVRTDGDSESGVSGVDGAVAL